MSEKQTDSLGYEVKPVKPSSGTFGKFTPDELKKLPDSKKIKLLAKLLTDTQTLVTRYNYAFEDTKAIMIKQLIEQGIDKAAAEKAVKQYDDRVKSILNGEKPPL